MSCGPERLTVDEPCAVAESELQLTWAHACEHTSIGPFGALEAASGEPELRNTHMFYVIDLGDSGEDFGGRLRFVARSAGRYAFYADRDFPLTLADAGTELCPAAIVRGKTCLELQRADVYDLRSGQVITLVIGPWHESSVKLVVELQ